MTRRISAILMLLLMLGIAGFIAAALIEVLTEPEVIPAIVVDYSSPRDIDESKFTLEVEVEPIETEEPVLQQEEQKTTKQKAQTETPPEPELITTSEGSARKYIGRCRLTIYTPTESHWGYTTATGVKSQHLQTCAVDPSVIPYGNTVILITKDGNELHLKAVDCGNFKGKMIDVFYDGSVKDGVSYLISTFGAEYAEVWIER